MHKLTSSKGTAKTIVLLDQGEKSPSHISKFAQVLKILQLRDDNEVTFALVPADHRILRAKSIHVVSTSMLYINACS